MAGALCLALAVAPPASGRSRIVHCRITVDGRTYLDGPCEFNADKDGSFTIGVGIEKDEPSRYFAYVNKTDDGAADALERFRSTAPPREAARRRARQWFKNTRSARRVGR